MAVTAKLFGKYLYHVVLGDTNAQHKWEDNTIKCVLCTSASNISTENAQDTLEYYSELTGEITGDGYAEGGIAISYDAGKTSTYSGTDNTITFDGDDAYWSNSTITAYYAVLYDASTSADSTGQLLIGYVDFGADQSSASGTFTVQWSSAGIIKITVA